MFVDQFGNEHRVSGEDVQRAYQTAANWDYRWESQSGEGSREKSNIDRLAREKKVVDEDHALALLKELELHVSILLYESRGNPSELDKIPEVLNLFKAVLCSEYGRLWVI